jgi:hypothetical protein
MKLAGAIALLVLLLVAGMIGNNVQPVTTALAAAASH